MEFNAVNSKLHYIITQNQSVANSFDGYTDFIHSLFVKISLFWVPKITANIVS